MPQGYNKSKNNRREGAMDRTIFISLLRNLLNTPVIVCPPDGAGFAQFAEKYCYHPTLQPMFTTEALAASAANAEDGVIYELRDELGIWVQFFRYEEDIFLVGPYVKQVFDSAAAQRTLLSMHMPASYLPSMRLYYSGLPLLSSTLVRNTVAACLNALNGTCREYSAHRVEKSPLASRLPGKEEFERSLDYDSVYRRYDLENRFLRMIETGDTANVLKAFSDMSAYGAVQSRYTNAVYMNPLVGLSMSRALVRKAAERGGASVIEINEITQRGMQRMMSAHNTEEQSRSCTEMIYELTDAVRRHRLDIGNYSVPIRKAMEYLLLNYTQEIKLSDLAQMANLSVSFFSKQFKKETGKTVFRYIAHLRCERAAELLRAGNWSVQDISAFVGYLDSNYFVKVFRKEHGMTPSEYRTRNVT